MKSLVSLAALCAVLVPLKSVEAFVPVGQAEADNIELGTGDLKLDAEGVVRLAEELSLNMEAAAPQSLPVCSPKPTLAEIESSFSTKQSLLSRAGAAKLNLPVFTVSATGNDLVLVQDYSRVKDCLAADGKTMLQYGQTIRTVITIADASAETNLTLAAVAANATITSKKNQMAIEVIGFSNPEMTNAAAALFGKELNVETYGQFAEVQRKLVQLSTTPSTVKTVERVAVIPANQGGDVADATMIAFALQQITDNRSCTDAVGRVREVAAGEPAPNKEAVRKTYVNVMGSCNSNKPTELQRVQAKQYLYKLEVSY